jgi:hypothetical protein
VPFTLLHSQGLLLQLLPVPLLGKHQSPTIPNVGSFALMLVLLRVMSKPLETNTHSRSFKNYGLTPAYNVMIVPFRDVIHIGAPVPMGVPAKLKKGFVDTPTLFPSMDVPYHIRGVPLCKEQSDLVRDGREYQLVYYGILSYEERFRDEAPHTILLFI